MRNNLLHFMALGALCLAPCVSTQAQQVSEKLNRAPVAVNTTQGVLVSWRSLVDDPVDLSFDVFRGTTQVASGVTDVTNVLDPDGKPDDVYTIASSDGKSVSVAAWSSIFTSFDVKRPSSIKSCTGGLTGRYRPDDMSVADLDGDGDYEIVLKWLPDNARDSGKDGISCPFILQAYEMDGTQLWSKNINLGYNIRSGNHNMQFLVYDFDGDGKAELICRTAAGSTDGQGTYVTEAGDDDIKSTDNTSTYVNSKGYVTNGEEFLTVFEGTTGKALKTIWYNPNRQLTTGRDKMEGYASSWGDTYGNRAERFNACVAYLDGLDKLPTAIMQRGYYTLCYIWAVDWNGTDLTTRWIHVSESDKWSVKDASGSVIKSASGSSAYGQGVHGISVGDVDQDGKDEICIGGATIDQDGALLCSTGKGHGDAIHLTDLCPNRPGLEVMMPHEESPYGYDVHDATTGELLCSATSSKDNGRGLAADFIPANRGFEFWSSATNSIYDCATGAELLAKKPDTNFRIYWTGDPYDQTFDGRYSSTTGGCSPRIQAYNTSSTAISTVISFYDFGTPSTCNTTKATPCLQADILGDWREELIMFQYEADYSEPTCKILIYSTPEPTNYKVPCLMQDHVYRMGVAWQNSSYNQPPHLGYYLPDYLGVDGSTYKTTVSSHAVKPAASTTTTEKLVASAEDKASVSGTCYTAGENGEMTNSTNPAGYIKVRSGNNDQIVFSVNDGYVITGIIIDGYSNNTSTTADRSIILTGLYVDDSTESLAASTVFPGGTAGQDPVTVKVTGFRATDKIVLTFDNSNITTAEKDSAGKNKQLYCSVTFYYEKVTAIRNVISNGTDSNARYNLAGQRIGQSHRGLYIQNNKLKIGK